MPEKEENKRPIAVIIGQLGHGGSERQLYMFLAHCDRSRWSPTLYVSSDLGELVTWRDPIAALGVPIVQLNGGRLAKMRQFRSACIAQGARSFFSWSSYTNGFGLALTGLGVHRIGSFRNASFADLPSRFRGVWEWAGLAGVSAVVCNSLETQVELQKRVGKTKTIVYAPNAVNIFDVEQIRSWREAWRARLGVPPDAVLIIGVGRIAPQKNFGRFIEAIAEVRKYAPVSAIIVGRDDGPLPELLERAAELGVQEIVRFLGQAPDAREVMCAADVFLLTSDYEGMPNVILEAMAAGLPCVSTRVNGVADLIDEGSSGFIADNNALALSKPLIELAANRELRLEMGAHARRSMEQRRPEIVVPELWKLCGG